MMGSTLHIKINSSEENKDSGFYTLMTSGASVVCLNNDEYIVNGQAIKKLNQKSIIYEVVVEDKMGNKEDATETEI